MTTNAQHTQGKWAVETEADVGEAEVPNVYVCHANTVCDATVVCTIGTHEKDRDELPLDGKLAIARLIAAAPDLLELAHQYVSDLRHPMSDDSRQRRIERALQVIAKATGEPK